MAELTQWIKEATQSRSGRQKIFPELDLMVATTLGVKGGCNRHDWVYLHQTSTCQCCGFQAQTVAPQAVTPEMLQYHSMDTAVDVDLRQQMHFLISMVLIFWRGGAASFTQIPLASFCLVLSRLNMCIIFIYYHGVF